MRPATAKRRGPGATPRRHGDPPLAGHMHLERVVGAAPGAPGDPPAMLDALFTIGTLAFFALALAFAAWLDRMDSKEAP